MASVHLDHNELAELGFEPFTCDDGCTQVDAVQLTGTADVHGNEIDFANHIGVDWLAGSPTQLFTYEGQHVELGMWAIVERATGAVTFLHDSDFAADYDPA